MKTAERIAVIGHMWLTCLCYDDYSVILNRSSTMTRIGTKMI